MSVNIVDVGVSRDLGARQDQEDRYVLLGPGWLKSKKEVALYAVYDGHGGIEAVNHVADNLHTYLEQHFNQFKPETEADYKHVIQSALNAVDRDLVNQKMEGGSTVSLILIDTKQGLLVQANLGDSHVVFADHEPRSPQSPQSPQSTSRADSTMSTIGDWTIEMLSVEHSPSDPKEKRRIEKDGGEVNYRSGIARIGNVSMSRALGDIELKKPIINRLAGHDLSDLPFETGLAPGKSATRDLISTKAHFAVRQLNGQSLILLASDGVGDAREAEEVTRRAVDRLQLGQPASEIAEGITRREGKLEDADNCTVVIVVLDTESKGRRSVDSGSRTTLEVPGMDGSGSRRRRRSSLASIKDWIRDR